MIPTAATLSKIDLNELFVKIELRAVLKIKIVFMKWFQELVHNTIYSGNLFEGIEPMSLEASPEPKSKTEREPLTIDTKLKSPEEDDIMIINTTVVKKQESESNGICSEEDILIDNPQKSIHCILCNLNGERSITGRLIPY